MIDQILIDLKEGVKKGITYSKESLTRAEGQFESLQVTDIEKSDFLAQFLANDQVKNEAIKVVQNEILPRFKTLQDYIFGEYQNHLRKGPGLVAMNNLQGTEFYQGCLQSYTSLDNVDPADLHQVNTLGQKSSICPKIHNWKISLFTKFTISKSHFSQKSQF